MKQMTFADAEYAGKRKQTRKEGRGRDGSYLPPPAQIRTCGTTAYGSCLRFVTRSVPPDKDVHFWA